MRDPTTRFSDRVDNYVRFRPAYPDALVNTLINSCSLGRNSVVADIGSGTGIFTRQLLEKQLQVIGVEPNREMRQAAENLLSGYSLFTSVSGSAEDTHVAEGAVDLIVAAQAFHWFRGNETKKEFLRILKAQGWVALIWNRRKMQQAFQQDYEALLREHAPEFETINHANISDNVIAEFFAPNTYQKASFENAQVFDKEGFLGRMQSSSYTPSADSPGYAKLMAAAEMLFAKYAEKGKLSFEYDTQMYLGRFSSGDY